MKPTKRQIQIAEHFVKKVLNEGNIDIKTLKSVETGFLEGSAPIISITSHGHGMYKSKNVSGKLTSQSITILIKWLQSLQTNPNFTQTQ